MALERPLRRAFAPVAYLSVLALAAFCQGALVTALLRSYVIGKLELSAAAWAGIGVAYLLPALALRLPAGRLAARLAARPATIYALAGCALSFAAIATAPVGWVFALAVVAHGACAAGAWTAIFLGLRSLPTSISDEALRRGGLAVEVAGAVLGAAAGMLLAGAGLNLALAALMIVWMGAVFAALAGLPDDRVGLPFPAVGAQLAGLRGAWRTGLRRPGTSLGLLLGHAALGLLALTAYPTLRAAYDLPQWQVVMLALIVGAVATPIALRAPAEPVRRDDSSVRRFGAAWVLTLAAVALGRLATLGQEVGLLRLALTAVLAAPGCSLIAAAPTIAALSASPSTERGATRLGFTLPEALGLAAGALLAGLTWSADRPGLCLAMAAGLLAATGVCACVGRR